MRPVGRIHGMSLDSHKEAVTPSVVPGAVIVTARPAQRVWCVG